MRLICSYTFLLVLFLRPWNVHGSFPGTWLPSSFSQLHDHRTQLCSVAVQEVVLVLILSFNSSFSQQPVLLCSVTVLVLCYLLIYLFLPFHSLCRCPSCLPLLASLLILSLSTPDRSFSVTLFKIPWVKMLCQLLIIGTSFDLLIAVFFKALLN